MTLFQALIYAALHGFTSILPVSLEAHTALLAHISGWSLPEGPLLGAMHLGATLALFIFFIHDWASMISSVLQVIIYRKKPMTLDERLPFFLAIATTPVIIGYQLNITSMLPDMLQQPVAIALLLAAGGLLLSFSESMGKRNKTMFDWTTLEAIAVAAGNLLALLPGAGQMTGSLAFATLRNFNREGALKFSLLAGLPVSLYWTMQTLGEHGFGGTEWGELLYFGATTIVTGVATFLGLLGISKSYLINGTRGYVGYRILAGLTCALWIWHQSRS
jgi:undecaprenyl-diphosphatase